MSSTLDRLRRLHGVKPKRTRSEPEIADSAPPDSRVRRPGKQETVGQMPIEHGPTALPQREANRSSSGSKKLEDLVPGEVIENAGGTCFVATHATPLGEMRGERSYRRLLAQHPAIFQRIFPKFGLLDEVDFQAAAFIDTETTGLGGGAGVYCFMVGVGTFESVEEGDLEPMPDVTVPSPVGFDRLSPRGKERLLPDAAAPTHFVVRQFFMRNPAEEGALLVALAELLQDRTMTVTFNGRTFDLPLLRARVQQNARLIGNQTFPPSRQSPSSPNARYRCWQRLNRISICSCRRVDCGVDASIAVGSSTSKSRFLGLLAPMKMSLGT